MKRTSGLRNAKKEEKTKRKRKEMKRLPHYNSFEVSMHDKKGIE